jgi:hypothetical protein
MDGYDKLYLREQPFPYRAGYKQDPRLAGWAGAAAAGRARGRRSARSSSAAMWRPRPPASAVLPASHPRPPDQTSSHRTTGRKANISSHSTVLYSVVSSKLYLSAISAEEFQLLETMLDRLTREIHSKKVAGQKNLSLKTNTFFVC